MTHQPLYQAPLNRLETTGRISAICYKEHFFFIGKLISIYRKILKEEYLPPFIATKAHISLQLSDETDSLPMSVSSFLAASFK